MTTIDAVMLRRRESVRERLLSRRKQNVKPLRRTAFPHGGFLMHAILAACLIGRHAPGHANTFLPALIGAAAEVPRGIDAFANRCFHTDSGNAPSSGASAGGWAFSVCFRAQWTGSAWQQSPEDAEGGLWLIGRLHYPGRGATFTLSDGDVCPATGRPRASSILLRCIREPQGGQNETLTAKLSGADCSVEMVIASPAACSIPDGAPPGPPAAGGGGGAGDEDRTTRIGVTSACITAAAAIVCVGVAYFFTRSSRNANEVRAPCRSCRLASQRSRAHLRILAETGASCTDRRLSNRPGCPRAEPAPGGGMRRGGGAGGGGRDGFPRPPHSPPCPKKRSPSPRIPPPSASSAPGKEQRVCRGAGAARSCRTRGREEATSRAAWAPNRRSFMSRWWSRRGWLGAVRTRRGAAQPGAAAAGSKKAVGTAQAQQRLVRVAAVQEEGRAAEAWGAGSGARLRGPRLQQEKRDDIG